MVLPPSQTFPDNIQVSPQDREQNGNAYGQAPQTTGGDESRKKPKASPSMNGIKNPYYAPSPGVTPKGTPSNTDDELDEGPAKGDAVKKQNSTGITLQNYNTGRIHTTKELEEIITNLYAMP